MGVEALVEAELVFETGREREEEASAAVLVFEATVMLDDVVEGETVAEVHDLVNSAVERADGVFELRTFEVDPAVVSSSALASTSRLDGAVDCGMTEYRGSSWRRMDERQA